MSLPPRPASRARQRLHASQRLRSAARAGAFPAAFSAACLSAFCQRFDLQSARTCSLLQPPLRRPHRVPPTWPASWCCGRSPPLRQGSCGTTCSSLSARQTPFEAANTEASVLCTDCNGNRKDEEPKIRMIVFTSRNRQWHRWRHGLHAVDQVQPNALSPTTRARRRCIAPVHVPCERVEISNPATA